jgi:ArsR family transcriptional regulator
MLYSIFRMLNINDFQISADLLKALAHPARLAIVAALGQHEVCVCHLEAVLGLRQAYLSQQLMSLREAGLVLDRRAGHNVYYRVCGPHAPAVLRALGIEPRPGWVPIETCVCPHCQAARARAQSNVQLKEFPHA